MHRDVVASDVVEMYVSMRWQTSWRTVCHFRPETAAKDDNSTRGAVQVSYHTRRPYKRGRINRLRTSVMLADSLGAVMGTGVGRRMLKKLRRSVDQTARHHTTTQHVEPESCS